MSDLLLTFSEQVVKLKAIEGAKAAAYDKALVEYQSADSVRRFKPSEGANDGFLRAGVVLAQGWNEWEHATDAYNIKWLQLK